MAHNRAALEFTAAQAHGLSRRHATEGQDSVADALNFTLTIQRVLALVRAAGERGEMRTVYVCPWLVIDGTSTDPVRLARQVEARLRELGYDVTRTGGRLLIDWDKDLQRREAELKRQHEEEERAARRSARAAERARLQALEWKPRDLALPQSEGYGDQLAQFAGVFPAAQQPPLARGPRQGRIEAARRASDARREERRRLTEGLAVSEVATRPDPLAGVASAADVRGGSKVALGERPNDAGPGSRGGRGRGRATRGRGVPRLTKRGLGTRRQNVPQGAVTAE